MTREVLGATVDLARARGATPLIVVPQFGVEEQAERALRRRILDETGLPYVWIEIDEAWRLPWDRHPERARRSRDRRRRRGSPARALTLSRSETVDFASAARQGCAVVMFTKSSSSWLESHRAKRIPCFDETMAGRAQIV